MIIFTVVGMPASGKNAARTYATSKGIAYFASGDIVRAEVKKRGIEPNARNTSNLSTELRGNDGMGVTREVLASAMDSGASLVFMEGMRSWPEIQLIRQKTHCVIVAFLAPRRTRLDRVISRGRSDDSPEAFEERDMREISYGAATPIALSDEYVLNIGTMEDALDQLDDIVKKYIS
jgi:dephospho-CoA kinase